MNRFPGDANFTLLIAFLAIAAFVIYGAIGWLINKWIALLF